MHYARAMPFHEWRTRGSFIVASCTKKAIVIEAAGAEIGAVLLADTECLLDHAAEHNASIFSSLVEGAWSSPAWTVVTAYYWSFFSMMALTRLTGHSAVFLDRPSLLEFRTLAGAVEQPGAGALYLDIDPDTTATTNRTLTLMPSKVQLHEAVWIAAHRLISDVVAHADEETNALEYRFWSLLKRAGDLFGRDWCSKLRNSVNYKPGFGYREVTRRSQIDMSRQMMRFTPLSIRNAIESFEGALNAIPRGMAPSDDVKLFSRLLGFYSIVAAAIVDSLHADLLDRQGGDKRWRRMRDRFLTERCSTSAETVWPFTRSGA